MRSTDDTTLQAKRWLTALLPVAVFVLALVALHRSSGELHLRDILAEFRAIEPWRIAAAVVFAGASFLVLTAAERIALTLVRVRLPWRRYALTSFLAYAIGNNLGGSMLPGAAIRYRLYSALGMRAADIASVVAFGTITFALGVVTLTGAALIAHAGEAAPLLHVPRALATGLGIALLGVVAAYVVATARRRKPIGWRGWHIPLPSPRLATMQLALSSMDLLFASACAYVLLPATAGVSFAAFAALFMVALAGSVVTAVPGGVGVFESILVLLLARVPASQVLGALLAYRLVYYLLPFLIALLVLTAREATHHRRRLGAALAWTHKSLDLVVPYALAVLVFGTGLLLLLSGATPGITTRLATLDRFLPLPVLELSHLAGSAVGVLLLILARGLTLRLDGAWHVTMWLLGAGVMASLLKGLDYEEALLLVAVALPLWWSRAQFYRKASLLAERLSPRWIASAAMAVGASIWVGLLAYRHVPYAHELWWQFALDAHAPRMLRASLLAVLVLGWIAALRLLAPARTPSRTPSAAELERALPIVRSSPQSSANLALLGDKSMLFSESGRAFLMYALAGRSWVAMGDPVGPSDECQDLIWRFRELADQAGGWSVFYEVGPEQLAAYVDAGLALSKLGEEARVRLDDFSLEGSARAELRQAHNRARRDGLRFRIVPGEQLPVVYPALQRISDAWLRAKGATEKGFSLGRFSFEYVRRFPCAVVEHEGRIVAFANLWTTDAREELSVDIMRHCVPVTRGAMDFLLIEVMLWGRAEGYRWFNLGMAPLAGLEPHRLAPLWHKAGRFVSRHGTEFYNFEGLRRYKQKFLPEWRPRYLAAPGGLAMPVVLYDVTRLISGRGVDPPHATTRPPPQIVEPHVEEMHG
jgi:phosphatidylglycerol lysyltransferase